MECTSTLYANYNDIWNVLRDKTLYANYNDIWNVLRDKTLYANYNDIWDVLRDKTLYANYNDIWNVLHNKILYENYNAVCYKYTSDNGKMKHCEAEEYYSIRKEADNRMFFYISNIATPSSGRQDN